MTREYFNAEGAMRQMLNDWTRKKLPESSETGFTVNDIDLVLRNYKTKKIMLLEIKCQMAVLTLSQSQIKMLFDKVLNNGLPKEGWQYLGFHLLQFEKTFFHDGKVFFDGKEKTEAEIIDLLSF